MNELQIFNNEEFGQVRTIEDENGKILFVASDVAKVLGYAKPNNAVNQHCRCTLKRGIPHPQSKTKILEVAVIPESDLYRLIANSELPEAEEFERWIFEEILPSIRKHGAYLAPQKIEEILLNPDTIIKLATDLKAEREQRQVLEIEVRKKDIAIENRDAIIESQIPAVIFADSVSTSKDSILVGEMAKILNQNGIETGEKRLYQWLRDNKFLISRKGTDWNMPTQKSVEMDLFEIAVTSINHSNGETSLRKTSKVTGKGQRYFVDRFLKDNPKPLSFL